MRTTVYGTIYDASGQPYEGAIIKFIPNSSFTSDHNWVQDTEIRAYTNSYGTFEQEIPPTVDDSSFYFMTIVYDKITTKPVVIPRSDKPVNFVDLKQYLFPHERAGLIGCC